MRCQRTPVIQIVQFLSVSLRWQKYTRLDLDKPADRSSPQPHSLLLSLPTWQRSTASLPQLPCCVTAQVGPHNPPCSDAASLPSSSATICPIWPPYLQSLLAPVTVRTLQHQTLLRWTASTMAAAPLPSSTASSRCHLGHGPISTTHLLAGAPLTRLRWWASLQLILRRPMSNAADSRCAG
jgi:hypothetical protein